MKYRKNLLFGFLIVVFVSCAFQTPIVKSLREIPKEDREELDWFFRYLFHDTFPYVLFGNKPMCIHFLPLTNPSPPKAHPLSFIHLPYRFCLPNLRANKGWNTWKKYRDLFPSSNFLLLENRGNESIMIVMINKYAFLKIVKENIHDFKRILDAQITPETLLDQCLTSNDIIKDTLKDNDHLLGILLGFGSHNAQLFSRRSELENSNDSQKFSLSKKQLFPSEGYSTLDEELHYIHHKLTSFEETNPGIRDFNPLMITFPGFLADQDHPETHHLKTAYKKQYRNILRRYKNGNFLEITLKQFCG